ncbi:MAG: hypothetical protein ACK4UJ_03330 [Leptonema sp. (in: bacteria)]
MFGLFEAYGIESEYILVDNENLEIKPLAKKILKHFNHSKIISEINLND